jgi:hypothetical protein
MNPIQTGYGVQDLSRTLRSTVDGARDPQYSSDEFTSYLSKLLSGLQHQQAASLTSVAPVPVAGGSGPAAGLRFDGFDFTRAQNPQRSAKDAFAMLARASGTMPTGVGAEQWFAQQIAPGMEKLGHHIDWVKGPRFQFTNWQGTFAVEFVRGTGSPAPALAWGLE